MLFNKCCSIFIDFLFIQAYFITDVVHVHMVAQEDVLSFPSSICDLNLNTITPEDLHTISHKFSLYSMGSRQLNSVVLWFDVWFPGGLKLSTSPDNEDTHWQNTVLPLATVPLQQDTRVEGELIITQDLTNHRFLNVDLTYQVENGEQVTRCFKMDDNCNDNDFWVKANWPSPIVAYHIAEKPDLVEEVMIRCWWKKSALQGWGTLKGSGEDSEVLESLCEIQI